MLPLDFIVMNATFQLMILNHICITMQQQQTSSIRIRVIRWRHYALSPYSSRPACTRYSCWYTPFDTTFQGCGQPTAVTAQWGFISMWRFHELSLSDSPLHERIPSASWWPFTPGKTLWLGHSTKYSQQMKGPGITDVQSWSILCMKCCSCSRILYNEHTWHVFNYVISLIHADLMELNLGKMYAGASC